MKLQFIECKKNAKIKLEDAFRIKFTIVRMKVLVKLREDEGSFFGVSRRNVGGVL